MAPPKRQTLPKPLPEGFILTDAEKKQWRLGRIIGQGGFGLIYLASQSVDRPVPADSNFVIKVEYHENGPLFSELKFYQRAAKKDSIQKWMRKKSLDFLGIPTYWGHGSAQYKDLKYRFMAMDRLGSDLQKICGQNGGRFKPNTVLQLGQRLVDVLEYIHVNEYVHADIKAANLMQGHRDPHQVYLADYGLSYRYCPEGVHKEYKEDPKKGHDGTIEYTSLDAHRGVASSRRSDLQILGFCLLHWLCGSLPWDKLLNNPVRVQEAKTRLMQNLPESVQELSSSRVGTDEVVSFLLYVKSLDYKDKPDYQLLKGILCCSGGELDLSPPQRAAAGSSSRTQEPQSRNKKTTGRSRGQARAEAMEVDADGEEEEEEQRRRPKQIPAKYLRGPPIYKPQQARAEAMEVDEDSDAEEEERRRRPKQIPAKYLRGPPIYKPQQIEGRTLPERSVHHNSKPFHPDDQDEDEEQIKPKPIAAHYLRGPPTGPRDDSDQQAKTKPRTSERRPTWRQDMETATNGDVRTNSYRDDKHWREYEPSRQFLCEECGHRAGLVHTNRTGLQFWCLCAALFGLGLVVALITTHFYSVFTSAPPFSQ